MNISRTTARVLLVSAFAVACGHQPTELDDVESPQLKRVKAPIAS